jgi:hypothetical protein
MGVPDYRVVQAAAAARTPYTGPLGKAFAAWSSVDAFAKHANLAGAQRIAAIANKADAQLRRIAADRSVPEHVRLLQHHDAVRAAREELSALRDELRGKFEQARSRALKTPGELPIAPHAEALLMSELRSVRHDPLAWSMLYKSADRLTAQTMEKMPPVVFSKNGTAGVEPAVSDEQRRERWYADMSPEDRAEFDAVHEAENAVNSLVSGVLNEANRLAGTVVLPPPPEGAAS